MDMMEGALDMDAMVILYYLVNQIVYRFVSLLIIVCYFRY